MTRKNNRYRYLLLLFLLTSTIVKLAAAENLSLAASASSAPSPSTLQDPTKPPAAFLSLLQVPQSAQALNLVATFIYPAYRLALINDQIFKIGDLVGNFTITSITPYTVELIGPDNSQQQLQLVLPIKTRRNAR